MAHKAGAFIHAEGSPLKGESITVGGGKKNDIGFYTHDGEQYTGEVARDPLVFSVLAAAVITESMSSINKIHRREYLTEVGLDYDKLKGEGLEEGVDFANPTHSSQDVVTSQEKIWRMIWGAHLSLRKKDDYDVGIEDLDTYDLTAPPTEFGGLDLDTSNATARGLVKAVARVYEKLRPGEDLSRKKIFMEGGGGVGQNTIRILLAMGFSPDQIIVSDPDPKRKAEIETQYKGVHVICDRGKSDDKWFYKSGFLRENEIDIVFLNALGEKTDTDDIDDIADNGVEGIFGMANAMFKLEDFLDIAGKLEEKGILSLPDPLINFGGWYKVVVEYIMKYAFGGKIPVQYQARISSFIEESLVAVTEECVEAALAKASSSGAHIFIAGQMVIEDSVAEMQRELQDAYWALKNGNDNLVEVLEKAHIGNLVERLFEKIGINPVVAVTQSIERDEIREVLERAEAA